MHNPDFIAFKDSQTDIEFIVRNIDRKPINLTGRKLFATLVNYRSGETLANIPLVIVDAVRGICRLSFEPFMVKDMPLGFHRYSISYMLDNGNAKILTTDQYESGHGFFELQYGRELSGLVSQEYAWEQFTPENQTRYETYYVSPHFEGNLRNGSLDGIHTFAWYLSNFTGSIWVEGSIVESTPDEPDWFPILIDDKFETVFDRTTDLIAHNIESNLQWVRFKVRTDMTNTGKLSKVVFRK